MKKIARYAVRYWYVYLIALLFLITSVFLDMLSPKVLQSIIDDVIVNRKTELLARLLFTILIIGTGRAVCQYVKEFLFDRTSSRISVFIRKDLFTHIQGLSVHFFDKTNTGELMSRVKDDVDRIWNGLGYVGMLTIEVAVHTTMVLYFMLNISPTLSIIPIIAMPAIAVLAVYMEKKLDKIYEEISEENAKLNTVAQENLAGVRTVKSFAREKFEIGKFLSHNKQYKELNMKQSTLFIKYHPYFSLVTRLLPVITLIVGGRLVIKGDLSLGGLGAFIIYCDYIVWPMEMLGWLSNDLAASLASIKKLAKIYEEKPIIAEPEKPVLLDAVKGHISFQNVSLCFGNQKILEDISFDLKPGKTLGIMGATGAGKTSIINLLGRFYDTEEGAVYMDGINVKELSLKQLRGAIAPVMQDVFLFSDTINENVKLGKRDSITTEEVADSLYRSQAMEFISTMEDGFETLIGERGVGLSGGQKQRISIARAFAKKAPVLVMDDSTSALDMETEYLIQKELNELSSVTKIIIAHRISAVRRADEIIVLSEGRIAERGNHESLLAEKGLYYETFMAQYGEYLEEGMG